MATPRLYGAVSFRYDPTSEAAIFTLIGADGIEPASPTNGLPIENIGHLRIQEGKTFVHNNVHSALAAGASHYHILTTSTTEAHLTIYATTSDAAPLWVEIGEAPTFTGGTVGAIVNKNRKSARTPTVVVVEGATVTNMGTHLEGDFATGTRQTGGAAAIQEEWILKANTSYAFLIRNDSTGAVNVSFHLEWYEEQA